jgi:hypothetical protein
MTIGMVRILAFLGSKSGILDLPRTKLSIFQRVLEQPLVPNTGLILPPDMTLNFGASAKEYDRVKSA